MRELKFRAWSKKHNRYLKLSGLHYEGDKLDGLFVIEFIMGGLPNTICLEPEDVVLEQYTGLKDNNGKEIYEGDIVRYFDVEDHISEAIIRFGNPPIPYTNDDGTLYLKGFYLDWLRTHNDEDFTDDEWERLNDLGGDYEVIGNIHENPELLGGD